MFGVATWAVAFVNGYQASEYPLVIVAAFIVGFAMAAALTSKSTERSRLLIFSFATAVLWAATQLALKFSAGLTCGFDRCEGWVALPMVGSASFYDSPPAGVSPLDITATALDAAAVGLLIYVGCRLGMKLRRGLLPQGILDQGGNGHETSSRSNGLHGVGGGRM